MQKGLYGMDTVKIFYSYSHKDEVLREELEKHLSILKTQGFAIDWHDRKITAGKEWAKEIDSNLNDSDIILLLISADFMVSEYCNTIEVKRAMERHLLGEARVIPVIIREVYWQNAPFGQFQALPKDGKPVISKYWNNLDEAFTDITKGILEVIEELRTRTFSVQSTTSQMENNSKINTDSDQLYSSLLRLDYRQQVKHFKKFVEEKNQVGSFLIDGEPEHGQSWLLHRLLKLLPYNLNEKVFLFSFQRLGRGRSLNALWRELGSWVGLRNCQSPLKIAEQIYNLWQTQSVILILRNLSCRRGIFQYVSPRFLAQAS